LSDLQKAVLNKLPYYLPYSYIEQWDSILLSQDTERYQQAVFNYLSCAHLILPRQQVVNISKKLNVDPNSLFFSELLQGNTEKAMMMASSWLQTLQEKKGHRKKELPGAFGILYAIVLLVSGEPGNAQLAATFVRNAKKQLPVFSNENNPFKQFAEILLMFINHRIGKNQISWRTIYHGYQCPIHQQLLTVVLSWLGKPLSDANIPLHVSEKEEMEYRASGLKFENETDENREKRLKELEKKLNSIPLAGLFDAEEPWEILLSALSESDRQTKTKKSEKESRLIWIVDPMDEYSLEVFEQTKNKTGWSKGKQRSLAGLLRKIPDFATPEDIRTIDSMHKEKYYGITAKKWEQLIEVLSVHPHVYTNTSPQLPLEIRIEEAQIQIDKKGEGASIKLNPSSPHDRVVMETRTRYIYTKWSPKAIRIYHLLAEQGVKSITIPADGMKKARPVIDSLGEVMPLTGNFATTAAKIKRSANIPILQLTPVNDQLHVQLLIEVLKDEKPLL
ncbi:MAG: hypothetical protein KAJ10_16520, partial [Thermodesulfovibrionia bacterium]|nr:hypothetical protein [Thermodesulfovibrionia bacterium]